MRSLFSFITFLSTILVGLSAQAADYVLKRPCQEHLVSAKTEKNLIVDASMGLLRLLDYDEGKDVATVGSGDFHRTFRMTSERTRNYGAFSKESFRLNGASGRTLAEMGHRDASNIIHQRTSRLLGIRRSGLFFAARAIRAHYNSSPIWRTTVLGPALQQVNARRVSAGLPTAAKSDVWENFKDETSITSPIGEFYLELIQTIYKISGENLVRSGILQDYADGYNRNWTGIELNSDNRPMLNIRQPSGSLSNGFIPQDVDHYVRGFLWAKSAQYFKLVDASSDFFGATRLVVCDDGVQIPRLLAHLERIPAVQNLKKVDAWIPAAYSNSIRWRKIFDAAGTIDISPAQALGQIVILLSTSKTSEYLHEEMLRKLYDRGAVRVISVRE